MKNSWKTLLRLTWERRHSQKLPRSQRLAVLCPSQPINNQCCGWTGPCGSSYNCKMPLSNNHQGALKKNKCLLLTGPVNYIVHLDHIARSWVERKGQHGLGSAFNVVRGGAQGFLSLLFIGEIKTEEWEFKAWEEQKQLTETISY